MKKYLLEDFKREISQIKDYIKHIQQVNDLVEIEVPSAAIFQKFKNHFISFKTDKKVFEYKAIIISLYGLLEKYIELWIKDYLDELSRLISYDKLPEIIRKSHFEFSLKLINIVIQGRLDKYSHLKKEDILKKLNNCIENSLNYGLNVDAFTIQSGNLKHNRIEEIFKSIDIIIGEKLIKNAELNMLIGVSQDRIKNLESSVLFGKINELVERRNTIAHGATIDDLLGLSELNPYIDFLEKYCIAIFDVLEEKIIENQTIQKYEKINLVDVYNKSIIAFSIENYEIKIGDWVIIKIAEQNNERFYKKEIKSVGKEGRNDYVELKIKEKTNVAIGIDNQESLPITKSCTFYLENKKETL